MEFQVKIKYEAGEYLVTCPDLPEFATVGATEQEAKTEALDGIETTLQAYMQDRRSIPEPSGRRRGTVGVRLPAQAVMKLGIYEALLEQKHRKADLARMLDLHLPQIDRMLDLRHNTKLEQLEKALNALGRQLEVRISEFA